MHNIHAISQWQEVLEDSDDHDIVVFKHSDICPVSAGAYTRMDKAVRAKTITAPVYIVVVQQAQEVSDQIAHDLAVRHESPQVIVVRKRSVLYDASHDAVMPEDVTAALSQT